MDLDFTQVDYDGELDDFSEDELRELVRKFEDAQESNVAEFEEAASKVDELSSTAQDFEQARESLIGDITDSPAFSEIPATEDTLEDATFGELQEWADFVDSLAGDGGEDPEGDGGSESEFDDFGQKSPSSSDDDEAEEFAEEALSGMAGVNF